MGHDKKSGSCYFWRKFAWGKYNGEHPEDGTSLPLFLFSLSHSRGIIVRTHVRNKTSGIFPLNAPNETILRERERERCINMSSFRDLGYDQLFRALKPSNFLVDVRLKFLSGINLSFYAIYVKLKAFFVKNGYVFFQSFLKLLNENRKNSLQI